LRSGLERRLARIGTAAVTRLNGAARRESDQRLAFEARVKLAVMYRLAMIRAGLDPDDPDAPRRLTAAAAPRETGRDAAAR
jgi:hypothetical protein